MKTINTMINRIEKEIESDEDQLHILVEQNESLHERNEQLELAHAGLKKIFKQSNMNPPDLVELNKIYINRQNKKETIIEDYEYLHQKIQYCETNHKDKECKQNNNLLGYRLQSNINNIKNKIKQNKLKKELNFKINGKEYNFKNESVEIKKDTKIDESRKYIPKKNKCESKKVIQCSGMV